MPSIDACVVNLGCRVNRVESDWFETSLVERGCQLVPEEEARLVIVNTCAVTGEAQAKTRKAVRRAASLPCASLVVVTGCVANLFPDELESIDPRVRVLASKDTLVQDALALFGEPEFHHVLEADADSTRRLSSFRLRLGVKVQDGCENKCTYCIIWKARGPVRSVPVETITSQVAKVLHKGAGEIVLTGINLGKFKSSPEEGSMGLAGLVEHLCAMDVPLLRISSIEPPDMTEDVVRAIARNADRVAAHLHIPLQAGCDSTLSRMGRRYSCADYARMVEMIREALPGVSLSTDVIVGFPGETEDDFAQTLAFCRRMRFGKIHVFRFSARPGTPAADFPDQVSAQELRNRSERLRVLGDELRALDCMTRVGTSEPVLIESIDADGIARGTTASYHDFYIPDMADAKTGVFRASLDHYDEQTGMLRASICSAGTN